MNKRFIRVAVFCTLTATAAPVFVGCSDDYDADIANLQDQINKINGVIGVSGDDMAAAIDQVVEQMQTRIDELSATLEGKVNVDELTASVDNLKGLIDQKADPSAIEAEATRLEGLIDEANKAAADASEEVRQNLEQQISELEQKQDEAQLALNEALNGKVSQDVLDKEAARLEELINDAKQIASGAVTPAQLDEKINTVMGEIEAAVEGKVTTAELKALRTSLNDAITAATNDMATNAAVQEKLDALDAELTEAIGKKMDISTFNSLKNQLTTAIGAKADTAFVNQEIRDLNAELESVKAGYATTAITDQLNSDLTTVTNDLANAMTDLNAVEKLAGQQGQAIADLQSATSDLQTLRNNITALQSADLDLSVYADFSALANRVQALETKWGQSVRDSIEDNTNAIEEINRQINGYFDEQAGAEVKGIFDRLVELEGWKKDIVDVTLGKLDVSGLEEGKVADIAQILNDIEELQLIVKGEGEEGEENTLNFYNKTEIDNMFAELETKVTTLFIGQMVQSIVYVPFGNQSNAFENYTTDGNLTFKSLILKKVSETQPVAQKGSGKIAFRVSPAAAAQRVLDDYNLTLDSKQDRDAAGLPITLKEGTADNTTGIITYDVDFSNIDVNKDLNVHTWIFCATLTPKAETTTPAEGETPAYKDQLTAITSDYFLAEFQDTKVDEVKLAYSAERTEIAYKAFGDTPDNINFNEGVTYTGWNNKVCVSSNLLYEFSALIKDGKPLLTAEFTEDENDGADKDIFVINNGILTPGEENSSAIGTTTDVSAVIKYGETEVGNMPDFRTVELVQATYKKTVDLTSDFTQVIDEGESGVKPNIYNYGERTFKLSDDIIGEIQQALDLRPDDFLGLDGEKTEGPVTITKDANSGDITVTYNKGTYLEQARTIVLELQTRTAIKVELTVNLPAMSMPVGVASLEKAPGFWNADETIGYNNLDLTVIAEGESDDLKDKLQFISNYNNKSNLGSLFKSYTDVAEIVDKNKGTLTWEVVEGGISGIKVDGNGDITVMDNFDKIENKGKLLKVKLTADFITGTTADDVKLAEFTLDVVGPECYWKSKDNDFAFENLVQTLDLSEGWNLAIEYSGGLKGTIWKNGEPTKGVALDKDNNELPIADQNAIASTATDDAFDLFKLNQPVFALDGGKINGVSIDAEEAKTYVTLLGSKLSITEEGRKRLAPGTTLEVKVKVTTHSRFNDEELVEVITVTAKA